MRLVSADSNLVVAGRCFEGFPLLLDNECQPMEPAQSFLWDIIGKSGRIASKESWETYGRATYDYFAFILTNGLDWNYQGAVGLTGPVEAWRDWSKGTVGLKPRTINQRLRVIVRFYEWAVRKGLIDRLPFDKVEVMTHRNDPGFLGHVDDKHGKVETTELMLRESALQFKFLTKDQIRLCHTLLVNHTHQLMFDLMVRTGLRQIECRTFPEKYVFDPSRRKDLRPGQKIRLHLDSRDMRLKCGNPRDIDVSYDLMESLWAYAARHRQRRANANPDGAVFPNLFLTEGGVPYKRQTIGAIFRSLSSQVGFTVKPHMLRHSYATYLLFTLRKSKTFEGDPLLYVRDRLGHRDVSTTTIYLHLVNSLEGTLVLAHEDEIDRLFAVPEEAAA